MTKQAILLLYLCTFLHTGFGQTQNFWVKQQDFTGLKRERAVAFSLANKGYICSGVDTTDITKKDLWEYDPETDTWTQKADLPASSRRNAVGFSISDIGYIGLGMDSADANVGQTLSDFWAYDPLANTWVQNSNFPGSNGNGLYFATGFSIDGKGYICGGKRGPNNYTAELWEYKPLTDTWIQKSNFPGGVRYQLTSFVIDNFAYIGLGIDQDVYRKDLWQYNPATNGWIQKNDFQGGERGGVTTFTLGQRGFICLGSNGGLKKDLWEYNPFTDAWSVRSNFGGSARKNAIAFTIDNHAYVGTGKGESGKKMSMYKYTPYHLLSTSEMTQSTFQFYPIPAQSTLNLQGKLIGNQTVELLNQLGQVILSTPAKSTLDIAELPSGLYIASLKDDRQNYIHQQIIIKY